ncbi:Vacuolar 14 Fab1-binding region [Fragilaria crotonensis]|nr:Vacuolar 14 Fab1-binding region [Fragilaria crotonensis]
MVRFALMCMADSNLEMGVRDSAALVIATLAEAKPKSLGKEELLISTILDTLFLLIENSPESAAGALLESNPAWKEDMNLENATDEPTETSMAQGTLDMLACEIPKKYIFQPVMSRCIARLSSSKASARKAGIAGLGVIAEGCAEPLREHLHDVMPHVFSAAGDGDAQVRECACFALGQISEHCQPEILGYSTQILPIVFALLDDTTVSVQATSCYVLEMFCERLEPDAVRPLLDPLVRKLAAMLEATTKRSVQEMAVAALAATAVAAEEEFTPYVGGVAALMTKLMALQEERLYSLRGRALECMGHMAIAVGKQTFRPYFTGTMQCACDGLATESTDLHEFAYAVFANLAKVMGEEFAPVLPDLVPHLIKVIGANEGHMEKADDEDGDQFNNLDDSDDEEDEDGAGYVLHVRTALLEAKKGAITAIGEMAAHTGSAFVPHLEEVMEVLSEAGRTHWHPLVKCEVAEALPSMVIPSVAAYHNGEISWEKGDVRGANPMSQHTAAITSAVLAELIALMQDDDKDTVGKACEGIQSVIELVGPHALVPVASECLKNTHELLTKKAPCQQTDESFEQLEDDDDHDSFMTSVCDLVGGFARVMGPHLGILDRVPTSDLLLR